jgi:hypothetical protein
VRLRKPRRAIAKTTTSDVFLNPRRRTTHDVAQLGDAALAGRYRVALYRSAPPNGAVVSIPSVPPQLLAPRGPPVGRVGGVFLVTWPLVSREALALGLGFGELLLGLFQVGVGGMRHSSGLLKP